jgi:hypothetical protein
MQQVLIQPTPAERVYYAKYLRRTRWSGYIQLVVGAFLFIDGILQHLRSDLVMGIIFIAIAPSAITYRRRVRLVVTADGITYFNASSVLYVPWQDMEYIGRGTQRLYPDVDGIILRAANWKSPLWLRWNDRWRPRFIPLWSRWNGPYWDREVFDNIFHYAPWLAGEGRNGTVSQSIGR